MPAPFFAMSPAPQLLEHPFAIDQHGDLTLAAFAADLTRLAQERGMGETVVRLKGPAGTYQHSPVGANVYGVTEGLTGETYLFFALEPGTDAECELRPVPFSPAELRTQHQNWLAHVFTAVLAAYDQLDPEPDGRRANRRQHVLRASTGTPYPGNARFVRFSDRALLVGPDRTRTMSLHALEPDELLELLKQLQAGGYQLFSE